MNLWDEVLARVETKINRHSFYTWFKPTAFVALDSTMLTVRVPNPLFKVWLTKHYAGVIGEAIGELQRNGLSVVFIAESSGDAPVPLSAEELAALDTNEPTILAGPGPAGLNPRYTFDTFIVGPSN